MDGAGAAEGAAGAADGAPEPIAPAAPPPALALQCAFRAGATVPDQGATADALALQVAAHPVVDVLDLARLRRIVNGQDACPLAVELDDADLNEAFHGSLRNALDLFDAVKVQNIIAYNTGRARRATMLLLLRRLTRAVVYGADTAAAKGAWSKDAVRDIYHVLFGRFSSTRRRWLQALHDPDGITRIETIVRETMRDGVQYERKDQFPGGSPWERVQAMMGGIFAFMDDRGHVCAVELSGQVCFDGPTGIDGAKHAGEGVSKKFERSVPTGVATSLGGSAFMP